MPETPYTERMLELAQKWLEDSISEEEKQEFTSWYQQFDDSQFALSGLQKPEMIKADILNAILNRIHVSEKDEALPVHRVHFLKTSWFRYAAAVVILLGGVAVWYRSSTRMTGKESVAVVQTKDIQPGTNRAILTVGNNTINLSNNKTGITVGKAITYSDKSPLPPFTRGMEDSRQLLQLTTPKGGQYQAVLPDGSKVWLNAASSIKFPSKFAGDKREVEVTGEAYLEVAKNTKQPFYVHTNKETIQVLGTSFNVNAYADEETEKTTLIDGSVRVISATPTVISTPTKEGEKSLSSGDSRDFSVARTSLLRNDGVGVILKPNQQAIIKDHSISLNQLNHSSDVVAWKNGFFKFRDASIESIMRQLARWYNLEVKYEGKVTGSFVSTIPRNVPISKVLEVLELTSSVHFKVEGNKVTVMPP